MIDKNILLENIKLFVLDLDGTFYMSERIYPNSLRFIERVHKTGRRFIFLTNNSSKTPRSYIEKISRMGLEIDRSDIVTSGDVMIDHLKKRYPGKSVYLLGTEALRSEFAAAEIYLFDEKTVSGSGRTQKCPDIMVAAFDMELTYEKLTLACDYVRSGAVFLATHEDINCPVEGGFIPDCGSICAAITLSTGRVPQYLGKPHIETVEKILSVTNENIENIAFVGDRIYTDVACGVNNGAKGLLVLSGETKLSGIQASDVKPDAIFKDLGEIADLLC